MTASDPILEAGQRLGDKYRILRRLGAGGYGVVYEAEHELLGERVAIKCLRLGLSVEPLERRVALFLREARMLFALSHPAIVRLYDVGTLPSIDGEIPYVVLELLTGGDLRGLIESRRYANQPLSAREIEALGVSLLSGLAHAHANGVTHRDLKPTNVMLAGGDAEIAVKIVDFGLARWTEQQATPASIAGFTPAYAAPEQVEQGAPTGPRTDVFAAGLVIAELCTLQRVVQGTTPADVASQLLAPRKVDVASARPDLPPRLEAVLARAVSADPSARQANAGELLAEFRAAFAERSASAQRPVESPSQTERRYVTHALLASGGMGTVHLGSVHGADGFTKIVAVKKVRPDANGEDSIAAFEREARIAARVVHANVTQVLDVVREGGELAIVLEYVHGATAAEALERAPAGGVPLGVASGIVCGVLHGLHAAHEARGRDGEPLALVHRDVSPQNVIIGSDGVPRLLDFGIAKGESVGATTATGVIRGKLGYAAPEQLEGRPLTRSADVYGAGVLLWELVTGERLFDADRTSEILEVRARSFVPRSPLEVAEELPPALVACIMRALAPDPEDRHASAAAMARALEDAVPPASSGRIAEWLASHCGELLAERDRQRRDAERAARPASEGEKAERGPVVDVSWGDTATAEPPRRPSRLSRAAIAGMGALAAAAAVTAAFLATRPPRTAPVLVPAPMQSWAVTPAATAVAPVQTPAPVQPPPETLAAPPPSSLPSAGAPIAASAPRTDASRVSSDARSPPPRAKPASAPPSAPPCVPWHFDAEGNKHYNKACIR